MAESGARDAQSIYQVEPAGQFAYLSGGQDHYPKRLTFRHADIEDRHCNELITLGGFDTADGGLNYDYAFETCKVIALNRSGKLLDEQKREVDPQSNGGNLPPGEYYYSIDRKPGEAPYAIANKLSDWKMPEELDKRWYNGVEMKSLDPTTRDFRTSVINRDGSCRMSKWTTGLEAAHLVDVCDQEWYMAQNLRHLNRDACQTIRPIHTSSNGIALRADLHQAFEQDAFVLFPKSKGCYEVHVLEQRPDLLAVFHRCRTHTLYCDAMHLYARFAIVTLKMRERVYNLENSNREPRRSASFEKWCSKKRQENQVGGAGTHDEYDRLDISSGQSTPISETSEYMVWPEELYSGVPRT